MQLPESILLQKNIIYIVTYLDNVYSKLLFSNLIYLNFFSRKESISFFLNVQKNEEKNHIIRFNNLLILYDLVQQSKKTIKTYATGLSYDETMLIGGFGHKNQKFSILNSYFGLSKAVFSFNNTQASDFIKMKSEIIRINFLKNKLLKTQIPQNANTTLVNIENDLLFNSYDAINYGIIDKII